MKKLLTAMIMMVILSSCKKDPPTVPDYLDPERFPIEIQSILKQFLREGNARHVYKDINIIKRIIITADKFSDGNGGLYN